MYVKTIICEVGTNLKRDFSIAQTKWDNLKNINGFIAQIGGWNNINNNQAYIISLWKNKETLTYFMNHFHDQLIENSQQNKTYQSIKIHYFNKNISLHQFKEAIDKNFIIIDTKKILLENSWTILSQNIQ